MAFLFSSAKSSMVTPDAALPGRDHYPFEIPADHAVLGTPIRDLEVEATLVGGVTVFSWQPAM